MLRCKSRYTLKTERLRCGYSITDGKDTRVKNTDDISGIGFLYNMTLLCHHLLRLGQLDFFIASLHMCNLHARFKFTGADTHKGDTVTMCLIHICLNLKYKGREIFSKRINFSDIRLTWQWGVGHLKEML